MGSINLKDLNFNMNLDTDGIDKITKKLEFDDIADIIHDNVQKAVQGEVDKAKREDDYNQKIEDSLVNDPSVIDDTSMESAMGKMNVVKQPTIYQPSLFEAIMLGNKTQFQESAMDEVFTETIHEYTKLNMTKALKLEKFDLQSVRNMANSYLA
jgi:SpoVK/Ycf46/Vps4 family AAA+-type ATPase